MKFFAITIVLFLPSLIFSQDEGKKFDSDEYAVSISAPLFYQHNLPDKNQLILIPFEYILNRPNLSKTSISVLVGTSITEKIEFNWRYYIGAEISKIIPIGRHGLYAEIGSGVSNDGWWRINGRIGGRLELGNQFMLKAAYTPYMKTTIPYGYFSFYEFTNFLSISAGYRFNPKTNKTYRAIRRSIKSVSITIQPFFINTIGKNKALSGVSIESLIRRYRNLSLLFEWGVSATNFGFYLYIPVGLNLQYGKKNHFVILGVDYLHNLIRPLYLFQAELTYRLHLGEGFFTNISYAPYLYKYSETYRYRAKQDAFLRNVKFGIGYSFQ